CSSPMSTVVVAYNLGGDRCAARTDARHPLAAARGDPKFTPHGRDRPRRQPRIAFIALRGLRELGQRVLSDRAVALDAPYALGAGIGEPMQPFGSDGHRAARRGSKPPRRDAVRVRDGVNGSGPVDFASTAPPAVARFPTPVGQREVRLLAR